MAGGTFTFLDGGGVSRTHRSQVTSSVHTPATILYDESDNPLLGQQNQAGSLPVVLASDDDLVVAFASYLTAFLARHPVLGQAAMAASMPVVIASNQSAIPVSGTVSVTEPVSVDDNGASLTTDTPQLPTTLGQKVAASSLSVVLAMMIWLSRSQAT